MSWVAYKQGIHSCFLNWEVYGQGTGRAGAGEALLMAVHVRTLLLCPPLAEAEKEVEWASLVRTSAALKASAV